MQGTIPYLGTFLTDLVMMDTAMKDCVEVRDSFNACPLQTGHFDNICNDIGVSN